MRERRLPAEEVKVRAARRCAGFAPPPRVELPTIGPMGLRELYSSGRGDFDLLETGLVMSARIEGPLELATAEGLLKLTVGDGLFQVGLRLDDYAREVLDFEPGTAMKRVRLARRLRTRPLLREAIRRGEVTIRAAEVVAPVATGDAEAEWVKRASTETVRALEHSVKAARPGAEGQEGQGGGDEFGRFTVRAKQEQLPVIDLAFEIAAQELPGSKRFEQLEAIAQEWLGGHPETAPETDPRPAPAYRAFAPGETAAEARKEQLERETERWRTLDDVAPWKEPDLRWEEVDMAEEADATLRQLAAHRRDWNERVGWIAHELARSRIWATMGFATFRHYVEERLGLPPRAVEQRARLEERIRKSPALEQARAEGVSYERLRALARLPERDIPEWLPRAKELTVIALREALDARDAGQMRARGLFGANVPERVARLVTAAFELVRAIHPPHRVSLAGRGADGSLQSDRPLCVSPHLRSRRVHGALRRGADPAGVVAHGRAVERETVVGVRRGPARAPARVNCSPAMAAKPRLTGTATPAAPPRPGAAAAGGARPPPGA